jgi:hypothetical protein
MKKHKMLLQGRWKKTIWFVLIQEAAIMQKLIKNHWCHEVGQPFERAKILNHEIHPEGLDVERIRFCAAGSFVPNSNVGHILSVIAGSGRLCLEGDQGQQLQLVAGVHTYLPPGVLSLLEAEAGAEFLCVSAASVSQARGQQLLVRDEMFLAACASEKQSLRWILTPQYLSRRIFLRHDQTLLSKSGHPVSWFRTTMFDVDGLPKNEDGEPVFKMSYNSRTEFNVCYDVKGTARVRMALHPYKATQQSWIPWQPLDGDSTYHLNESAGGPEEECVFDKTIGSWQPLRNRHEVCILNGYVTLFCLFDPAPAGIERHQPGEYTDYEPPSPELYQSYLERVAQYDEMVDQLSLAKAMGNLEALKNEPIWKLYLQGRAAQAQIELELANILRADGRGREHVIADSVEYIACRG